MRFGMRYSSAFGAVDDIVRDLTVYPNTGAGSLHVLTRFSDGWGDRYAPLYVDGIKTAHDFAVDEETLRSLVAMPDFGDFVNVFVEDGGDWADPNYDPYFNALDFEAISSDQGTISWYAAPRLLIRSDSGSQLSGLSLSGLRRFSNVERLPGDKRCGILGVVISDSGGTRTVELYQGSELVAAGSRSGDGAITLLEQNDSRISGSVTIAYTADVAIGTIYVEARWPKQYQIHYSTSALSFPRTPEATLDDDGFSNYFKYTSEALVAGTYNVAILPVSDTGQVPTSTSVTDTWTISTIPGIPLGLVYYDGNSTNTRILFTAPDATSTYNIYASEVVDGPIDMSQTVATETAAAGEHIVALPSFGAGITGTHRILVRTVSSGGVEEKNGIVLPIEYSAGTWVVPRPNTPYIKSISADGYDLTVVAGYNDLEQENFATHIQLFVKPEGTALDYTTPQDEVELSVFRGGRQEVTLTYTVVNGDKWYTVGVRAATIDGQQDANTDTKRVRADELTNSDVTGSDFRLSRGG